MNFNTNVDNNIYERLYLSRNSLFLDLKKQISTKTQRTHIPVVYSIYFYEL